MTKKNGGTYSSVNSLIKGTLVVVITALTTLCFSGLSLAGDYKTDIGYTALQSQLGSATSTGAGVRVSQVEAPTNDVSGGAPPIYMPDPGTGDFLGKTITPINGNPSGSFSGHATGVGQLFYGNGWSIAPGVTQIDSYQATAWINSLLTPAGPATTNPARIANQSWVGGASNASTDTVLRLTDRQVQLKEYIQVVGAGNSPGNAPLLGSAFNVITVGRTDGLQDQGTDATVAGSIYGTGRVKPDLVAPQPVTSTATPVVSAAAALLVQTGHNGGLALSQGSTSISGVGTIYNAERSETVKAVLMSGADRETANTSTSANITDYRSAGHQTSNGLDDRFGAGQVNIFNSYHILAAGEQSANQAGGRDISLFGFDYVGSFGGLIGSPRIASYFFNANNDMTLSASLVWNMSISNDASLTATLHHLNLSLFDVTQNQLLATSASSLDNTQNIYLKVLSGDRYELRVTTDESGMFSQDYALAWRIGSPPSPVPLPAAAWLFAVGLTAVGAMAFRRPHLVGSFSV